MSETSQQELRSFDETLKTNNESIDDGRIKIYKEEKMTVEEETAKQDVKTLSNDRSFDNSHPRKNSPETQTFLKEATRTIVNENVENAPKGENNNNNAHLSLQETTISKEISNAKASSLSPQNIDCNKSEEIESKDSSKDEHAEHVTYTQDGTAIYTDPKTNYKYKWCTKENKWISSGTPSTTSTYENEHYKWCSTTQKWIPKQTQLTETEHYKWDADKKQWVAKAKETKNSADIVYSIDEDGLRTYTDTDGTVFFWDVEKNAWFPKIDEDFMARYQMSYGFIDNTSESEKKKKQRDLEMALQKEKEFSKMVEEAKAYENAPKESANQELKRKQPQESPKWFEIDPAQNTKVYVSNLPLDITLDEFADVMGKCGMIMRDPLTQKYKLKLYAESDGQLKGDGLCDYIKVESVDLALKILDEYDLRGKKIRVQKAQFQMRGEYNPALKPKRKKKDKEKLAKIKENLFDWRPEKMRGERSKHEKTVIIKNLFHPDLFEKEVQLLLDYQNDLREECSKCGTVRKVVIYDRHSEGVAQVNMSSPEEADLVIQMMHGRYFGKRQLTADHWDGKTKYKIEETEEEVKKRLNKWDQYLEIDENKKSDLHQEDRKNTLA